MSETTWESIVEHYKELAARADDRIDELTQRANHWHDTAQMLKRQRDMAEEERDGWKIRAMQSEQQRQSLRDQLILAEGQRDQAKMRAEALLVVNGDLARDNETLDAECNALRKDAAVVAALQEPSTSVLVAMQSADSHGDVTDAQCIEMLRAALTAAMAVQPKKYRLPFIAHEKCHDFNSCARNQRCMYGKIGASGKWDNCFTAGGANE